MTYEGSLFGLLNPFALLCGLVSVAMLVMHGGAWLALKAAGPVGDRARATARLAAAATLRAVRAGGTLVALRSRRLRDHRAGRPADRPTRC